MNATPSRQGVALVLIVSGALVMVAATVALLVTHEPFLRFVVAAGGAAQIPGWLLHLRRPRPSAVWEIGPDNGDTDEWMGERFIWEPGDRDEHRRAGR
ncbi:hypothetical protein MUK60_20865 [Streptomyces sp. LRE541]|uniref:hypothetical protein n=1 Tax=Streptomyces sp. LRE541 TaxID=2931983 RepID=UPI00201068EB|nr:hypothetical protein [Streptomyces sp. LRE541]UPZ30015.1 hypothetical protein MUK60_20865 [Streptomyces sp. LRE541]